MMKPITFALITFAVLLCACSASGSAATSADVAGTYECFGIEGGAAAGINTLTLNSDGTGAFGDVPLTWTYDPGTGQITFSGDAGLQDATYLPDGPSLSVNLRAEAIVSGAAEGHFTCVKS